MKTFLFLLIAMAWVPMAAHADWAVNLTTNPAVESPVPRVPGGVSPSKSNTYYYFILQGTADSVNSSWLFIPYGVNVDICFEDDTESAIPGNGLWTIQVMHIPHNNGHVTPTAGDFNTALPLLGITLDGVASTSGTTNDCIYDVKGEMWIAIDISTGTSDSDDDAYVSVAHRDY